MKQTALKINFIVITALAFSAFSCQKEEQPRPAVWQQTPVSLIFKPTIYGDTPFLFGEAYLINQSKIRIDTVAFHLQTNYRGQGGAWVVFDEVNLRQRADYFLDSPEGRWFRLEFTYYVQECVTETVDSGGQAGTTTSTTCTTEFKGALHLSLAIDLDNDGSLESDFNIMIDLRELSPYKDISVPAPGEEITFNFHIDNLFDAIDFNELNRLSTQVRIAENLPVSLELE